MKRPRHLTTPLLLVLACALAYLVVSAGARQVSVPQDVPVKGKPAASDLFKPPSNSPKPYNSSLPSLRPLFRPDRSPFKEGVNGTQVQKRDYSADAAKYVLLGVTVLPEGARALIRKEPKDRFEVGEGETLDYFRVIEVTEGGVTLSADNQTVSLKMRTAPAQDRQAPAQKERQVSAPQAQTQGPPPSGSSPRSSWPPGAPPRPPEIPTPPARRM